MTVRTSAAVLGAVYAALHAADTVADHWVQSDRDACTKGLPGAEGRLACARHVASFTATGALALVAVRTAGVRPSARRVAAGLAVSAVTHYVIDRRTPLRRLAEATGKGRFYHLGTPRPDHDDNPCLGTGAYALDQAAHTGVRLAVALIIAGGSRAQ